MKTMTATRRIFLKSAGAAGGALMLGLYLPAIDADTVVEAAGVFEPNVWVKITADNKARIMLSMLEMGQGVETAMPLLLAEELDLDWNDVITEWSPADRRYGNPNFGGAQTTAGSNSTRGMWRILRGAGATARAMLVTAAAQTWGVPEREVTTARGEVIHAPSNRRLKYGELVDTASGLPVPENVPLKDPQAFRLLGTELARRDVPAKVNGTAEFGIDVQRPGMLVARVVRGPVHGSTVARFNGDKAKAVPGVRHVVPISTGIAVIADGYWAANKGAQAVEATWNEGSMASVSSDTILRQFAELATKPGKVARDQGDVDRAIADAPTKYERIFELPYLAHAPMEPMNCTAHVQADRCDVWVPTQSQTSTQEAAMRITGLPASQVFVHTTYLGGGFGRRGEVDFVTDAVEASKAAGAPVKVVWTREDDMRHDFYRPITCIRLQAAFDAQNRPIAWKEHIVQPSLLKRITGSLEPMQGIDPISVDGAADLPYAIPNIRVEYTEADPGIPYGFWRSVGNSVNGFVTEAFIDEMATTAGKDPYQFRRELLQEQPRHLAVLDLAAEKAGWNTPVPRGRSRGIVVHKAFDSFVGLVAEVSVDNGQVRVHKLTCAVDCGWIISPDTIKAQMEGGLLYGLTPALKSEITIRNGRTVQSHFTDHPVIRHNEAPQIDVYIVPSTADPGGIGEPSTAPIAGAVANAVFAATGRRMYRLPMTAAMLRGTQTA